ncbi:hypothetical protein GLAREA_03871 [Glarea lozoyensis ATCC 20868]|uniref:Uncharacterized protein n=1 Tax=Glarea lozoyensis (strain ATCC 20868 / MF5171) TaxID=1116229 RepID=S3D174_GLAL2|nr:uncharacterized protein GLAREA_03871 [Glarea lozoyensis ATCC 20868]EPE30904.1 hypothetical protein GLAREA_03871 [Glarea lozoyensis ATCC 20868]
MAPSFLEKGFFICVLSFNLGPVLVAAIPNTITAPATLPTPGSVARPLELRQRGDPAVACWSSWSSYRSLSTSSYMSIINLPGSTETVLPTYVETYYNIETVDYSNATYVPLCPTNWSWLTERRPTTTLATSYYTNYDYSTWYPQSVPQTLKPPSCTYSRSSPQCSKLWSSWSASSSALSTATDDYFAISTIQTDGLPPCEEPEVPCPDFKDRVCTVRPDAGTLYYWPVTTTAGDFCEQNGTTVTPTQTKKGHPNTVVIGTNTFTSPSVYLVLNTLNGYYSSAGSGVLSRYGKCGPTIEAVTLTLPPAAVSSVRFLEPELGHPVNYGDLPPNLVPVDPLRTACPFFRACSGWGRSGIKNYEPFFQVPHEVLKAQWRQWNNCTGWAYVRPSLKALQAESTTKAPPGGVKPTARPSKASTVPHVTAKPKPGKGSDDEEEDSWRHHRHDEDEEDK